MIKELKSWGLLLLLAVIWGSSFILMKKGMFNENGDAIFSAPQVANLRILIASLVLLPFAIRSMRKLMVRKDFTVLLVVGLSGNLLPAFLFTYAQTGISSGLSGMLNSFTPVFTLIIGTLIFRVKVSNAQIIGSFIGLIGIVLLILLGKNSAISGDFKPILAVICATFLYGLSLNLIKHKLSAFKPIEITSLSFTTLLIPSIIGFFYFDTPETIMHNHDASHALIFITILAVIGTAMAVFLFNGIIKISSALFASSVTYFIPIAAVIIGFLMKEKITSNQIMAMIIVLLGVLLIHHGDKFVKRGVDSKTRSN